MTPAEFLVGVEVEDGRPIVLSRYGWRKMELDGKTYLVAATREEALEEIRRWRPDELYPELLVDGCAGDASLGRCYNTGKCKKKYCLPKPVDTGVWLCYCSNSPDPEE